jgi:hypothetical protein
MPIRLLKISVSMKSILLFLLLSLSCWSQTTAFTVRKKALVWENVVITNETGIPELISRHSRLAITSSDKSVHKGKGTLLKCNCAGSPEFMHNDFSFDFEIELGEGKYRITVSDIVYIPAKGKKTTAEKYFLEKGTLKDDEATKTGLACIDAYFNRIFSNTEAYKNKM